MKVPAVLHLITDAPNHRFLVDFHSARALRELHRKALKVLQLHIHLFMKLAPQRLNHKLSLTISCVHSIINIQINPGWHELSL